MKRRNFIKVTLIGSTLVGTATYGYLTASETKIKHDLTIKTLLKTLTLYNENHIQIKGEWGLAKVFTHCAQSVNYSMLGYPAHKSTVFKNTVGSLAFSLFSTQGKMSHSLNEVIPGAPMIEPNVSLNKALKNLKNSLITFQAYQDTLKPHFAFGSLTKDQYALAHVLHIHNHLENFKLNNLS